jgi:hypothetical protein
MVAENRRYINYWRLAFGAMDHLIIRITVSYRTLQVVTLFTVSSFFLSFRMSSLFSFRKCFHALVLKSVGKGGWKKINRVKNNNELMAMKGGTDQKKGGGQQQRQTLPTALCARCNTWSNGRLTSNSRLEQRGREPTARSFIVFID